MGIAAVLETTPPARTVGWTPPRERTPLAQMPTLCSTCALRPICLPCGMLPQDLAEVDQLIYTRRRIRAGEHLYNTGEPFKALYGFRSGFFKSYVDAPDGQTQVIGFPMAGEIVGMDGIATDHHRVNVVALDDGEACVIPYPHLQAAALRNTALQHQLHKLMSREILREQGLMTLLGSMRADARVAAFLLGLSEKFAARGYSATQFHLRMTREEIGSYLGLKLETVSRVLSRFGEKGLIKAQVRSITIADVAGLKTVVPDF